MHRMSLVAQPTLGQLSGLQPRSGGGGWQLFPMYGVSEKTLHRMCFRADAGAPSRRQATKRLDSEKCVAAGTCYTPQSLESAVHANGRVEESTPLEATDKLSIEHPVTRSVAERVGVPARQQAHEWSTASAL